jgi:hypothetical protein
LAAKRCTAPIKASFPPPIMPILNFLFIEYEVTTKGLKHSAIYPIP